MRNDKNVNNASTSLVQKTKHKTELYTKLLGMLEVGENGREKEYSASCRLGNPALLVCTTQVSKGQGSQQNQMRSWESGAQVRCAGRGQLEY